MDSEESKCSSRMEFGVWETVVVRMTCGGSMRCRKGHKVLLLVTFSGLIKETPSINVH